MAATSLGVRLKPKNDQHLDALRIVAFEQRTSQTHRHRDNSSPMKDQWVSIATSSDYPRRILILMVPTIDR
jgi:hypothetical protein